MQGNTDNDDNHANILLLLWGDMLPNGGGNGCGNNSDPVIPIVLQVTEWSKNIDTPDSDADINSSSGRWRRPAVEERWYDLVEEEQEEDPLPDKGGASDVDQTQTAAASSLTRDSHSRSRGGSRIQKSSQ